MAPCLVLASLKINQFVCLNIVDKYKYALTLPVSGMSFMSIKMLCYVLFCSVGMYTVHVRIFVSGYL